LDALLDNVTDDLQPLALESEVRARIRQRILAATQSPPSRQVCAEEVAAGTRIQRAEDGEWRPIFPGVSLRHLSVDRVAGTQLALWRLAPGARIPPHRHQQAEECLVVDGSVQHAGAVYRAGDFLHAAAGSPHEAFETTTGATLLIRGELPPARLVTPPAALLGPDGAA